VQDLAEMIGHYLSVKVTYIDGDGHDDHVEFVGQVTAVAPLVTITRPGDEEPFTLPADRKSYKPVARSAFALDSWGDTAFSPRYETNWKVRAPTSSPRRPDPGPFRPRKPPS
jgi:hypothetical protein